MDTGGITGPLASVLTQLGALMLATWTLTQFVGGLLPKVPNRLLAIAFGVALGEVGYSLGWVLIPGASGKVQGYLAAAVFSLVAVALTAKVHELVSGGIAQLKKNGGGA